MSLRVRILVYKVHVEVGLMHLCSHVLNITLLVTWHQNCVHYISEY